MRTSSGVKPRMKGNAAIAALLFIFTHLSSGACFILSPDTLILDGEITEVEREEVMVNADSLREALRRDIAREGMPLPGAVSLSAGGTAHFFKTGDNLPGFSELGNFTGHSATSLYISPVASFRVEALPGNTWGLRAGISWTQARYENVRIQATQLADDATRLRFAAENGMLKEDYTVFISPGYEERSRLHEPEQQEWRMQVFDIPAEIFYMLPIRNDLWQIQLHLGATWRRYRHTFDMQSWQFVNEEGAFAEQLFRTSSVKDTGVLYSAGCSGYAQLTGNWQASAALRYFGLPQKIYDSAALSVSHSNISVEVGIIRTFNWKKPGSLFRN